MTHKGTDEARDDDKWMEAPDQGDAHGARHRVGVTTNRQTDRKKAKAHGDKTAKQITQLSARLTDQRIN